MSLDEFGALVKSVKYKPGVRLEAHIDWSRGGTIVKLSMLAAVPDAGDPEKYITINQGEWWSAEDILRVDAPTMTGRIFDFLLAFERHEAGEWFKVGDAKPFDPHAPAPGETYGRGD